MTHKPGGGYEQKVGPKPVVGHTRYPKEYHARLDQSLEIPVQILAILPLWNSAEGNEGLTSCAQWIKDIEGGITQPGQHRGYLSAHQG